MENWKKEVLKLRSLRDELKLKDVQISKESNIPYITLYTFFNFKKVPKLDTFLKIRKFLDTKKNELNKK